MSDFESRLRSLLAWRIICACEAEAPDTTLAEVCDPIDGRTLVLTSGDHPCQLVLNDTRGVTVFAPIPIETLPWGEVARRDVGVLIADIRATLGWERTDVDRPSQIAMAHAVLGRILASTSVETSEFWVSSLWAADLRETKRQLKYFATYEDSMLKALETAAVSQEETSPGEAWLLWRDASPIALFDSDLTFHTRDSRWEYKQLASEVDFCPRRTAHYCLDVLLAYTGSKKIFLTH